MRMAVVVAAIITCVGCVGSHRRPVDRRPTDAHSAAQAGVRDGPPDAQRDGNRRKAAVSETQVSLRLTGCAGGCAIYEWSLDTAGVIVFVGSSRTVEQGIVECQLDEGRLARVRDLVGRLDPLRFTSESVGSVCASGTHSLRVLIDAPGWRLHVVHELDCQSPEAQELDHVETVLNDLTGAWKWIDGRGRDQCVSSAASGGR